MDERFDRVTDQVTPGADELEPGKLDLTCTGCGYGVLRSTPPQRCPMCQAENAWILSASQLSTPVLARA
jgi:rubrerythrin